MEKHAAVVPLGTPQEFQVKLGFVTRAWAAQPRPLRSRCERRIVNPVQACSLGHIRVIGYVGVSTMYQNLKLHRDTLAKASSWMFEARLDRSLKHLIDAANELDLGPTRKSGRYRKLAPRLAAARTLLGSGKRSVTEVAAMLSVARSTTCRALRVDGPEGART